MNIISIYTLKVLRKVYGKCLDIPQTKAFGENDAEKASQIIYNVLMSPKPCMIARFGATELSCLANYIGVTQHQNRFLDYIKGLSHPWWWEPNRMNQMGKLSGFFPISTVKIQQFCALMLRDIPQVDVLGSWLPREDLFDLALSNSQKVNLELLNPYSSKTPWTKALSGKKVLVVHPFARTIERQYKKRKLLFKDDLLPQFELKTVQAVMSFAGNKVDYADWFEALEAMKAQIDQHDYDICLIGCGAYGFPLAAHVKRMGKKGFHLGGSLQLLFGIRGKRWENPNYSSQYHYAQLINEHWVRPDDAEKPAGAMQVEGGCYW